MLGCNIWLNCQDKLIKISKNHTNKNNRKLIMKTWVAMYSEIEYYQNINQDH